LQQFYPGRRIREFWRTLDTFRRTCDFDEGMSPRELCVLIDELPDESRVKRRFGSGWTTLELMIARLANDYRATHTAEGEPVENLLVPPNQREDETDEAAIDYDPVSNDDITRMLDGDMSVYAELGVAV